MERKHWIYTIITILALGGGGYGACTMMAGDSGEGLTMGEEIDPTVADPGEEPPEFALDAGQGPVVDPPDPGSAVVPTDPIEGVNTGIQMDTPEAEMAQVPTDSPNGVDLDDYQETCGDETCARGERCCRATGHCYATDCQDCCEAEMDPPTEDPRMTDDEPGPVR